MVPLEFSVVRVLQYENENTGTATSNCNSISAIVHSTEEGLTEL